MALLGLEPATMVAWPTLLITALSSNKPLGGAEGPTGTHFGALTCLGGTQAISVSLCLSFPVTQHLRRVGDGYQSSRFYFVLVAGLCLGPAGSFGLFGLLTSVKRFPV